MATHARPLDLSIARRQMGSGEPPYTKTQRQRITYYQFFSECGGACGVREGGDAVSGARVDDA